MISAGKMLLTALRAASLLRNLTRVTVTMEKGYIPQINGCKLLSSSNGLFEL